MEQSPQRFKDRVHFKFLKVLSGARMGTEQKDGEDPQGSRTGAALNTTVPQILFQHANTEAIMETADELPKRNSYEGHGSSINGGRHYFEMEQLFKYLKLTKDCVEGVQRMPSPKFNNEQCRYLAEKFEAISKHAILFGESQVMLYVMYSSSRWDWWEEIFKFLLVLGKQVEGLLRDCGKDAWIQSAMTLANMGEYVSSIGFNLELCKSALCEEGVVGNYTSDEVGKLYELEAQRVKMKASIDALALFNNAKWFAYSLNAQDMELAKCRSLKLEQDVGNPSFDDYNPNVLVKMFGWVKNFGRREEQIGRGVSARVYKAMWFGTPVAKKTFDGPNNEEFLQEAKVLSRLHHPNITSMFCCNMNKKECSIIMELMDGSFYDMLRSRKGEDGNFVPFSNLEGVDLMLQVGEGVNYLHQKMIVHRDLKSANILVKRLEIENIEVEFVQLKVVDFGLSKTKEASISFSTMTYNVGTFRWMALKIIHLNEVNKAICESSKKLHEYNFKGDIYSYGMVCYEILAGEAPFHSKGSPIIIKKEWY